MLLVLGRTVIEFRFRDHFSKLFDMLECGVMGMIDAFFTDF